MKNCKYIIRYTSRSNAKIIRTLGSKLKKLSSTLQNAVSNKLNFDYACQRGHSFNEYHLHSIINEIISSNIDPTNSIIKINYAPTELNLNRKNGRKKGVDFAILNREHNNSCFYIEAKWTGSSYCNVKSMLNDLVRLQLIKNNNDDAECIFLLAGPKTSTTNLFNKKIFTQGSNSLLISPFPKELSKSENRVKRFLLENNRDHQEKINKLLKNERPEVTQIKTQMCRKISETMNGNFVCFAWKLHQ